MVKLLHDLCLNCIRNNLDKISNVGNHLPSVLKEELVQQLADHDMFTPDYLPIIKEQLFVPEIKHVSWEYSELVTDNVLKQLASSGCRLKSLRIKSCKNVTDAGVKAITEHQNKLESLILKDLPQLTAKGLKCVKSPSLESLDLKRCPNISSEGVKTVLQNNKNIKEISLGGRGVSKLDDSVYFTIADALGPSLECLKSGPHTMSDDSLKVLAMKCPNLRELSLHGCMRISGDALIAMSQGCTNIKSLDLSYCNGLRTSPSNQALWTLPTSLTELSLCGLALEDGELLVECLQRLKKLKSIRLCGIPALNDEIFEKIMSQIGQNLTDIDLSGRSGITDFGVRSITKHCYQLQSINLSMCHDLTGEALIPLFKDQKRAEKIESLFLSTRKIEYEVLSAAIENCVNLSTFDMTGLSIVTDELLFRLAEKCPKLRKLAIKGCSQVTDNGICDIARCCPLRYIVLSGLSSLTDRAIFCIANHCYLLEEIYMNGCSKISQTTLNYLMDCCTTRLYIMHVTPNVTQDQLMAKNLDTGEFCRADLLTYMH